MLESITRCCDIAVGMIEAVVAGGGGRPDALQGLRRLRRVLPGSA